MNKSKIAGIAFNVPDNIVTNHDLDQHVKKQFKTLELIPMILTQLL